MNARTILAVVLAALLVPAAALAAPAGGSRGASTRPAGGVGMLQPELSVGGFLGYETDDVSGVSARVDGELPFRALAPNVHLSWVGSVGLAHLTRSDSVFGVDFDTTVNVLKLVPAARFSFLLTPQFTLFGDAGLGLYYASMKFEAVDYDPWYGTYYKTSVTDSEFNLMMRLGAGAWFQVNDKTRIGAMLEFNPYFGDFDQNTVLILGGAMFKL